MKKTIVAFKKHVRGGWQDRDKAYRVNVGAYSYYIRIFAETNVNGDVIEYVMDIGGRKKGCVSLRIPTLISMGDVKTAVLKKISYDPGCSINKDRDFVSGFGTKHMLKSALYFAKELCPNTDIIGFRFMDVSRKLCPDGAAVDLPYFMIALYGKTYYEKYFYAHLQNQIEQQEYQKCIEKLRQTPQNVLDFAKLAESSGMSKEQMEILQQLYPSAKSFLDFFQSIRKTYPDRTCKLLQGWIRRFIVGWVFDGNDLTERTWVIPIDKLVEIEMAEWEVINVQDIDMRIVNQEQSGGQYLGMWDPMD